MQFVSRIVFGYIFVLGLIFTFLVPPLQKPDEHGHFKRAVYVRQGYLFLWNDGKKLPLDRQFHDLITDKHINAVPYHPERKFDTGLYRVPLFAGDSAFEPVYIREKAQFMLGSFAYIPHAAGLLLARMLRLNAFISFFAGRFFMFLVSFVWMIFLYRRTKAPYRYVLLFAFSLPMFVHQITAYNYDGMHFMTGFTLFSVFTHLLTLPKLANRHLVYLGIATVLFLVSKVIYEPFILLVLLIPARKIAPGSGYLKKMALYFAGVLFFYFLFKHPIYLSSLTYRGHPDGTVPGSQLLFILQNPLEYLRIFVTSGIRLLKFHVQGTIGIFGWLDYSMHPAAYLIWLLAGFSVVSLGLPQKERLNRKFSLLLLGVLFLSYAALQTFFFLTWKPLKSPVIDGTQGRYFISFVPFLLFAFMHRAPITLCGRIPPRAAKLGICIAAGAVLVHVAASVIARYYIPI